MESPSKYFSELEGLITDLNNTGHVINVEGNLKEKFDRVVRKPYLIKLVENMKEQFQTMEVVSAFSPSELPSAV